MIIYDNEKDAEKAEGVIVGIDDFIYDDISEAEEDFNNYAGYEDANCFGIYIDSSKEQFNVAWN
jgi:hypothetical protein